MTKTNRRLKILQVLPALNSGGVEREVVDIANALANEKYGSYVASSGGSLVSEIEENGTKHFLLPLNSKNPITILLNVWRLSKTILENEIDIVHAQSRAPGWSAYFASKLTKTRFITTIHGAHSVSGFGKKLYNSIITKGEKIIAVSNFIANYAFENYKFDHSKLEVIHCGCNLNHFDTQKVKSKDTLNMINKLNIPTDKHIIMLPGRIGKNKGHLLLLEALSKLPKDLYFCLMVGSYSKKRYIEEINEKAKNLGILNNIMLTGNIANMPLAFSLADVVTCISTKPEAFGLVSIEAQAMGKYVIASNFGGITETIIPNKTGTLIEPNNPDQLAEAIFKYISLDEKTKKSNSILAIKHINENFSLETMNFKIINTYNSLFNKN